MISAASTQRIARAPVFLADYACARSMACCAAPWRATLTALEVADDDLRARLAPHLQERGELVVIAQPGGHCALLDRAAPACTLHRDQGLAALPSACRNFPRSIAATPQGWEVAFALACPTVAATVADRPQAFAWASIDVTAYAVNRAATDRVQVSRVSDWEFADVSALRQAWWQQLAAVRTGHDLLDVAAGLRGAPLQPRTRTTESTIPWPAPLVPGQVRALTEALQHLDTQLEHKPRLRAYWETWMAAPAPAEVRAAVDRHAQVLACELALLVQFAGVHDARPLADGLMTAAGRMLLTAGLIAAFERTGASRPVRDALVCAWHA